VPRKSRSSRSAEKRDELAAFQLIELHSISLLISSHRKLLSSEAMVVSVVERPDIFSQLPSGSSFVGDDLPVATPPSGPVTRLIKICCMLISQPFE
jgi:hypothetical protein